MTNSSLSLCKVGDRIECCQQYGTVKYIGTVQGKPATWLGIDWDDPRRGKHDGSIGGVKYFTTRHSTSGSFVRPERVEFGKPILTTILNRYGEGEDELTAKVNEQLKLRIQRDMNAPFVEMIGFDKVFTKQSNFNNLRIINLREQCVNSAGSGPTELGKTCPNVEELDLSKNLLSSWLDVFEICKDLKNLCWLNVSENLLIMPESFALYNFPKIVTLICGRMEMNWTDVLKICRVFSGVEELRLPRNKIGKLAPAGGDFKCLKILDLEGNHIGDWSELCKFNPPKLEYLIVENTGIPAVKFEGGELKVDVLPKLKKLCIVGNLIKEWESVGQLNRLRALENLKFSKNPVLETESASTAYQIVIAKIANIKILNGVEIEDGERRGAEYDYLKKYGLEWLKVKETEKRNSFLQSHNRYLELIERYGELEESELTVQSKVLTSVLINLKLVHGKVTVSKKVPPTMTVQKLRMLSQKLFQLKTRPNLTYISTAYSNINIVLEEELKEIGMYSMQDGDQIVVTV